jgi:phthiocerol/phenolphthiocerol synthesis type-I polyketide synthase A
LSAVRFAHPIVVDKPRVIQVVAEGESVTVSSRPATDAPTHRWVKHVSARLSPLPSATGAADAEECAIDDRRYEIGDGGTPSVAKLLHAWGVEGQPFTWSIEALRVTPRGAVADVSLTEPSTVALLDAAVHVARLVDGANPRLMVPADLESIWHSADLTDPQGSVEIRRLPGNADEIVVDIALKAPDGTTCVDIRALRYAEVDLSPAQAAAYDADPRSFAHAIEWRPWREDASELTPLRDPCTLAVVGGAGGVVLENRLADAGYTPAGLPEARYVLYLAEPEPGEADIDGAVRLTTEVGDLVRLLVDRDAQRPATL